MKRTPILLAMLLAACATVPPSERTVVARACTAIKARFNDRNFDCRRLEAIRGENYWLIRETWPPDMNRAWAAAT